MDFLAASGVGYGIYHFIFKHGNNVKVTPKASTPSGSPVVDPVVNTQPKSLFEPKILKQLETMPVSGCQKEHVVKQKSPCSSDGECYCCFCSVQGLEVKDWNQTLSSWARLLTKSSASVQSKCGECPCSNKQVLQDSEAIKYFGSKLKQLSVVDWSQLSLEALGNLGKFSGVFSMPESVSQKIADAKKLFKIQLVRVGSYTDKLDITGPLSIVHHQSQYDFLKCDKLSVSEKQRYIVGLAIRNERDINSIESAVKTVG